MRSILKKINFFLKAFTVSGLILILIGRYIGFTPKQLNPIPWKELFDDKLEFIIIISFLISLIGVFFESKKNNI
jgi:hypothetical protein